MQDISGGADTYLPSGAGKTDLNTTNPGGYSPGPEEKKTLRLADNLYKKAKQHRMKYDGNWLENYKFFRGKQWKEQRPSYRHSEVINLVFESIQSTVPIQTDSRPKLEYIPRNPMDTEFSQLLNKIVESDWEKGCWLEVLTEIIYEANFYGKGFGSLDVIPKGDQGLPEVQFNSKDPFYQYPDPAAQDCNKKCKFWVEAEPVDIEVLKKDYPDKAQYIKPDVVDLTSGDKTNIDKVRFKSPVDNRTFLDSNTGYDIADRNQALKMTVYIGPEEYEDEEDSNDDKDPITDASGYIPSSPTRGIGETSLTASAPIEGYTPPADEERKECANGRKIVIASGMVLYDGENPYDDKKFPYIGLSNYILPREFWGISEIEQLKGPNKIYNKIISFTLDVLTLMGNPIWVVDTSSGVDTDNLFNRPGLVVEKEPGTEVRRESGVELQPYVLPLLDRVKQLFDGISGAKDITRPVENNSVTAASAITALQEAAQTRLRLKARHLDAFLQQMGQMYVERVMQFYTAPRIFRLTGDDGGFKFFKFHVETMLDAEGNEITGVDGKVKKRGIKRDYQQNQETGQISENLTTSEYEIHGEFDVRVSTGSSLPFSKNEAADKAIKLYTLSPPPNGGVIDDEELLKALDYPNWEAVLQRVKERKAQQMAQMQQAAQQAAQSKGQPPPGR